MQYKFPSKYVFRPQDEVLKSAMESCGVADKDASFCESLVLQEKQGKRQH